jgi:hypothetical protein
MENNIKGKVVVGPALEVFVTVEPKPLYKRSDAGIIDPPLEQQ